MKKYALFPIVLFCASFQIAYGQPEISKKKFHLYLLAGQSNMAGRGAVETEDTTPHPRIWTLTKDNKWAKAVEPLHFDKPTVVGVGPGFAFAKAMAAADTNVVIGLIPCAVGGSPISVWAATELTHKGDGVHFDSPSARTLGRRFAEVFQKLNKHKQ
jgi:hypothetical protein